ncbi:glycosyltransferase family 2 protein [Nocardia amamiensis]|nr:glycosyltransferase [Nocardia amamiensis]
MLSVITAVHGGRADLLVHAGDSLAKQELPPEWELEWIVQEDGPTPHLADVVSRYHFARYAPNGEQLGIAATRNLALTRVSGELLHSLDSDDLLLPDALHVAIDAFAAHPDVHWVSAQADDLLPNGTRLPFAPLIGPGRIEIGVVEQFIREHDMVPIACPGLTMRTATVRALGGWAANPRWEDSMLFAALAALTPGWVAPVTWLYRQHGAQTTRQDDWPRLQTELWAAVHQRISAIREAGLSLG